MKFNHKLIMAAAMASLTVGAHAATVLYSENFNGEGTGSAYNDGTTPEINVGSIPSLQSTGSGQGGNGTDTAWSLNPIRPHPERTDFVSGTLLTTGRPG